eukprot:m.97395 g.97395  ORF g.97395 m.97395 type:complete len:202 (+) comp26975_c1_seq5:319-924(+)
MKDNEALQIAGVNCSLVPYGKHHVARYHAWMQSEELLEQTASEPLSLEKEYEMQRTWREDEDKCTFIVVRPGPVTAKNQEDMIGDVNLFINDAEDKQAAEIDIMIAESTHRGKGIGKEAVLLMMQYATTKLSISRFVAKISFSNKGSMALFTKLGFDKVSECKHFEESTLELKFGDTTLWSEYFDQHLKSTPTYSEYLCNA